MKVLVLLVFLPIGTISAVPTLPDRNVFEFLNEEFIPEPEPRISEVQEVEPHSIPSQVYLRSIMLDGTEKNCGGSLISLNYVLTAARCLYDLDGFNSTDNPNGTNIIERAVIVEVVLGAHNRQASEDTRIVLRSTTFKEYADYRPTTTPDENDIALILLPVPVPISAAITPIALPPEKFFYEDLENRTAQMSGWGETLLSDDQSSDVLMSADLTIISNEQCEEDFANISAKVLCAVATDNAGICIEDPGSPLIYNNMILIGISSFGNGCDESSISGFTRMTWWLFWLQDNTDVLFYY